jgi:uncharacterized protein YkwD
MEPFDHSAIYAWIRTNLPVTLCGVLFLFGIGPILSHVEMQGQSEATALSSAYETSAVNNAPAEDTFSSASMPGCGGEIVSPIHPEYEQRVVELTNQERAAAGLPPMKLVTGLTNAARYHAVDLTDNEYFQHDSFDRISDNLVRVCEWYERIRAYYPGPGAENLARGPLTPDEVMNVWMHSPSHRKNILGKHREIGVGYSAERWVQNFGTRSDLYPLIINLEAVRTAEREVSLYIYGDWEEIRLRTNGSAWSDWMPFTNEMSWTLDAEPGQQVVEAEMRTSDRTAASSDAIELMKGELASVER